MKTIIFCVLLAFAVVNAKSRSKREAFDLPDGADLLVGSVQRIFACPQGAVGYFADIDNDCKIFHVCNTIVEEDGSGSTQQYSFLCGNQTVFNQLTFTCAMPKDAVPCSDAPSFFYLNDNLRLGDPNVVFLDDQDIQRAAPLIQRYAASFIQRAAPPIGRYDSGAQRPQMPSYPAASAGITPKKERGEKPKYWYKDYERVLGGK